MMKFTCEKALLQSAAAVASRTVAPKSSIPALEGLLLETGTGLTVSGYNMTTGIRAHLDADVAGAGTAFFAFVGATFFVAALGMLVTHVELASLNATTFERPQITLFGLHPNRRAGAADRAPYDLGVRANWRQVFGPRPALLLLPVFSSLGDGYSFPENDLDKEP